MRTEATMRQLVQMLARKGVSEELIEAVLSVLETDKNFLKMMAEISKLEKLSETAILGKAMLIAES